MKIRIKDNTIRYRLTKSEVETFCETGFFTGKTQFDTAVFYYELKAKEGISVLEADFLKDTITVYFPQEDTKDWATNAIVGFDTIYKTKKGKELIILVEKDFVCMDETIEDQSDNYPNPNC